MNPADLDYCLLHGLVDVWSFNCGRRPMIRNAMHLYGIIHHRFDYYDQVRKLHEAANNR